MKIKTVDISGMGGSYELTCQKALWKGMEYLNKVDNPKEILKGTHGIKAKDKKGNSIQFVGVCYTPDSAKELENIWKSMKLGWTGAQHEAVVGHLKKIAEHGYNWWIKQFEDEKDRIYEIHKENLNIKQLEWTEDGSIK